MSKSAVQLRFLGFLAIPTLASALTLATPFCAKAAAGDECVKILGFEWAGEKQTMDPAQAQTGDDAYHIFQVYDQLIYLDDDFQITPGLAESWSLSPDGKTWTFKLRHGVKFHDGKDFGAKDVVYTFRRLLDPATISVAKDQLSFLTADGIQAVDPYTVTFTTKDPMVELPHLIFTKQTSIVEEGSKGADLRLHGVGTGPYSQEQFVPNGAIRVLRKNPNYWAAGLPRNDCLRITVAQEAVGTLGTLKSGQADVVLNVDPSVLGALKDDPNVTLLQTGAATAMVISMWVDTPPFNDVRVRQAMKLVLDRQQMIDTVYLGYAEVGNDNPIPPSSADAYTHNVPARNVEKAKSLLAEAGYPNGLKVDLYTAEGIPGMVKMAQVYAQMAKDAGIDVNVIDTPSESYWDTIWLKKPFVVSAWSRRSPAEALTLGYTQDTKWAETHWRRPDYDSLLAEAKRTVDDAKRKAMYDKLQQMLAEEGGVMVPLFVHQVAAVKKGCTGYTPPSISFNQHFDTVECKQ
jgi:peptide/nickel transport system substrate-binding protein